MAKQYLDLLSYVMENGEKREERTGTGTISVFSPPPMRFNLKEGFPLLTTKDMTKQFPQIFHELMWFIKGETNIKYLLDRGVNIWNRDAYRWYKQKRLGMTYVSYEDFISLMKTNSVFAEKYGDLGKIYGKQWADFGGSSKERSEEVTFNGSTVDVMISDEVIGINQLDAAINLIKEDPNSRRILVSSWNPAEQREMALPPCHVLFQFYVSNDNKLSCHLYMRSNDIFLGNPFNIASYALLTHMVAKITGKEIGELIVTIGDAHVYLDHIENVEIQAEREPYPLPELKIRQGKVYSKLTDFELEDLELVGYESHGRLKGEVSAG